MKLLTVVSYLVYTIYIHFIGTNVEYLLHRFIMHNDSYYYGKFHTTHHKHTDNKMNLINKNTKEYQNMGQQENLIIDLSEVLAVTIGVYSFVYIFYILYPIKINLYFMILVPLIYIIYTTIMWNSIHPYVHHKCGTNYTSLSLPCNITEHMAEKNSFVKWLVNNHKKHHIYKGDSKGNYNVTIPGADFLYNTYN